MFALVGDLVFVPFHGVGLSGTGLTVCEDGGVVASDYFLYHSSYLCLLVEVLLVDVTVTDFIEVIVFTLLIPHIRRQPDLTLMLISLHST